MSGHTGPEEFRAVMGRFPTGVTVVAAVDGAGVPFGLTVNSFTSVSRSPPLILVCIGRRSSSHSRLLSAGSFVVNVLAHDQRALAARFAGEWPVEERFRGIAWTPGPAGAPVLDGVLAWLECAVRETMDGGDHTILVGGVTASGHSPGRPLIFHRSRYWALDDD